MERVTVLQQSTATHWQDCAIMIAEADFDGRQLHAAATAVQGVRPDG